MTQVNTKKRGRPAGKSKIRLEIAFRSTGEKSIFSTYAEAGARLGVSGETLRVYLAHGKGKASRSVWSDAIGAYDVATVRRIGVDPLNSSI